MSAASGVAPRAFYRPRRNVQTAPSAQSATLVWLSAVGGFMALLGLFAAHQATLLRIAVPGVLAQTDCLYPLYALGVVYCSTGSSRD
jgi:hypothetical protein